MTMGARSCLGQECAKFLRAMVTMKLLRVLITRDDSNEVARDMVLMNFLGQLWQKIARGHCDMELQMNCSNEFLGVVMSQWLLWLCVTRDF